MNVNRIHHVGIVIPDLEAAKHLFGDILGMKYDHEESSDVWNVRAAFYYCGDAMIELLQPVGPGVDQDFLTKTGGGIHHICYVVDDIDSAYREMSQIMRVQSDHPLPGNGDSRIFFLDSEDAFNIETELLQLKAD